MNFYTILLAIAAVISSILSVFGLGIPGQILAFSLISLLLVLLSEAIVRKVIFGGHQEIKTNVDALKGQEGIVTFKIDNRRGEGIVKIRGTDWSARSNDDESIPEGTIVIIQRIEGVKVIVRPKETK